MEVPRDQLYGEARPSQPKFGLVRSDLSRVPGRDAGHREDRKRPAPATAVEVCPPYHDPSEGSTPKHEAREGPEKIAPVTSSLAVAVGRVTKWGRARFEGFNGCK